MKRAALERLRSVRVWRDHVEINAQFGHSYGALHPGHFRKGLRVGGCGNTACWLCHASKLEGVPTLQESRHLMAFREQLAETPN